MSIINLTAPPTTEIRLFGTFEALQEGAALTGLRTRKEKYLLALLVLRPNQRVERDWLAGLLWPDSRESQALYNLSRSLSNLRQVFGPDLGLASPTPRSVCLNSGALSVDAHRFDALTAQRDPTLLSQAVLLYRGPLLEDCLEEWALPERQVRAQTMLNALQILASRALDMGQTDTAIGYLRQAVALFPLEEPAYRLLMQALATNGEYAAAIQVFRNLRQRLNRELQAEPDAQTQAILRQLRAKARDRATLSPLPAATNTSAITIAPASAALPEIPLLHIPQPLTTLIGREWEAEEVSSCLERARLVTLTGAGGVGKTRLALHVAEARQSCYADGIWFVDLSSLTDPALVPQNIAVSLGVQEKTGQSLVQTIQEHLATRSALLILDNCEHLAAACATIIRQLLMACPYLSALATSRQALGIAGEADWRVPSLTLPPAPPLLSGEAAGSILAPLPAVFAVVESPIGAGENEARVTTPMLKYEAAQLFVERARQARRTFRPTAANTRAIIEICRRLDGIPLALELAAARVRVLPVEQIAALLDDCFRLLSGRVEEALPRHQTLRASIDWSHNLLTTAEQTLLRRLSVFAGEWPLAAVKSVCGEPPRPPAFPDTWGDYSADASFDLLTGLVDKSLVMYEERAGEARYRLLETVRAYAGEKLTSSGEAEAIRGRHADWFVTLAAHAEAHLTGPEQIKWLNRLEAEHDNLRGALDWCLRAPDRVSEGLRLVGHLRRFWLTRGYLSEGRVRALSALAHPSGQGPTLERAAALNTLASLCFYQADYVGARDGWEQGLAIQRLHNDKQGIAISLSNLGRVAQDQGDYGGARGLYAQSLALKRELGDQQGIALTLNNLCWAAIYLADFQQARALGEQSLALYRELGNSQGIADALFSLGQVALHRGEWSDAQTFHTQSLALRREMGDKRGAAAALNSLGTIAQAAADYNRARDLWEQSLALKRELGDRQGIGNSLHNLGNIAYFRKDYVQARTLYEQSMAIREEVGNRRGVASSLYNLGQVAQDTGDHERALELLRRSIQGHWELGDLFGITYLLTGFAELASARGQMRHAARWYGAHNALCARLETSLPPREQQAHQAALARVQATLDLREFQAAFAEGQAMPMEQVIAYALSTDDGVDAETDPANGCADTTPTR